jgi:hypothetical protein
MKDVFFVAYVVKEGSVSELSRDAFASGRMRAIARKFEAANFEITRITHMFAYFNSNGHALRLHRVPCLHRVLSAENAERLGGRSKDHQFPVGIGRESRPRAPDCRLVQKAELGAMFKPVKPVRRANLAVI